MTQHLWITAPQHRDREAAIAPLDLPPLLGRVDAHRRRRGPYSAAGELLRALVPGLLATRPGLVRRHDIELLTAAPELAAILTCERSSLTWTSDAEERTRFYPRAQTTRVGHGLTELLAACGDGRALVIENLHEADPTDAELVAIMLRRVDPEVLRLVITSRDEAPEHALEVHAPATRAPAGARSAAAYVAADCTSDEPAQIAAYEALEPAERAALHDARAHELEGRDEASLRLGAIPFHREHGSDPRGAGAAALSAALEHCVLLGFYHAVLDLGARALALLDWAEDPKACWLVVAKVTTALTALGRPDEAAELYDDACAATADPSVHLQAAYGRAMLFTRFYEGERRDHRTAKRHINTAIALASQMPASEARAFNLTFQENGLALIEMHLGDGARALRLVTDGLRRLDEELEPGTQTLQRSVLRYNRAQLLARMGPPAAALREYSEAIEVDPHHSEYYFERAAVQRKLGRAEAALADYNAAIRLSPPYPEAVLQPRGPAARARAGRGGARRLQLRARARPRIPRRLRQPRVGSAGPRRARCRAARRGRRPAPGSGAAAPALRARDGELAAGRARAGPRRVRRRAGGRAGAGAGVEQPRRPLFRAGPARRGDRVPEPGDRARRRPGAAREPRAGARAGRPAGGGHARPRGAAGGVTFRRAAPRRYTG